MQIYNTLSRQKEAFSPLVPGKVSMYVCGNTVYDECHIGHGRAMVVYDILYRHLLASQFDVTYVRNITDVDDKIINRALENGESPEALAQRFIDAMHEDEQALGVLSPTAEPRATETIAEMITMIQQLIDTGYAYAADNGDVFFIVKQFAEYGKLSGRKIDELRSGERIAIDQHKRDPLDFVLWKSAKPSEPSWDSPWGPGRPGWHIECSAMSMQLLGKEFDIHGGGQDLQFPHHENEIAQSEAISGGTFARYWMHNGLVNIGGEKMSKSLNNFYTIRDVLKSYTGEEMRYFIIASHYRSPLQYAEESLDAARTALRRFYTALRGIDIPDAGVPDGPESADIDATLKTRFMDAMNDDLNTPEAIAVLHEVSGQLNREKDVARIVTLAATLKGLGAQLGILQGDPDSVLQGGVNESELSVEAIDELIKARASARAEKDFARSDEIRDQLQAAGIVLEDVDGQTIWRRE